MFRKPDIRAALRHVDYPTNIQALPSKDLLDAIPEDVQSRFNL